jgi:Flp pilus assembly protein TadG
MTQKIRTFLQKRERGQILVLMGLLFIGLIAVVGLAIDLGLVFVANSRLNRAVDAAALAATGEFKRNYTITEMRAAARQLLKLNNVDDTNVIDIDIDTCKSLPGDSELCTIPQRKLVRVTVTQDVPLYFLSVVGVRTARIQAKAVSEAASLDVMLVLDNSPTMAFDAPIGEGLIVADPLICNDMDPYGTSPATPSYDRSFTAGPDGLPGECHPFESLKWASISFANRLNFEYDRLGIVTFNRVPHIGETIGTQAYSGTPLLGNITDDQATPGNESDVARLAVIDSIKAMRVYEGSGKCPWTLADKSAKIDPYTGEEISEGDPNYWDPAYPAKYPNDENREPCSVYALGAGNAPYYWNVDCPNANIRNQDGSPNDISRCTTTNIGGALSLALSGLQGNYGPYEPYIPFKPTVRKESVWVVIVVSDGRANAGYNESGNAICPTYTWGRGPVCRDKNPYIRQTSGDSKYDVEDFARDMADIVAQNSVFTFAIGFGDDLLKRDDGSGQAAGNCVPASTTYNMANPFNIPAPSPACSTGQELMGYLAVGASKKVEIYDNKVGMSNFAGTYYNIGDDPDQLERVFLDIYNKLTTKLTK